MSIEQNIWEEKLQERYQTAINEAINKMASVLRAVIFDLCKEHFADWWPFQYVRNTDNGKVFESVASRREPLMQDTSGVFLNILNAQLRNGGNQEIQELLVKNARKKPQSHDMTKLEGQLSKISNEDYTTALKTWLQQMPDEKRLRIGEKLVKALDKPGTLKTFLHTTDKQKQKIFYQALQTKYPISNDYPGQLYKMKGYRNQWTAHDGDLDVHKVQFSELKGYHNTIRKVVAPFSGVCGVELQQDIDALLETCKINEEVLQLKPILAADAEKSMGLPAGALQKLFKAMTRDWQWAHLDENATTTYFLTMKELRDLWNAFQSNSAVAEETHAVPEPTIKEKVTLLQWKERMTQLRSYQASRGKFNPDQLSELVSGFYLLADTMTLLSVQGLKVIADVLVPQLKAANRKLLVEWSSLSYIYRLEKQSNDPQERKLAHDARMQIFHLHKINLVQYVGTQSLSPDPDNALVQFVQRNKHVPICVMTTNRKLIAELNRLELPLCLCVNHWANHGLAMRTASMARFSELWELEEEQETQVDEQQEPENVVLNEQTALKKPAPQAVDQTVASDTGVPKTGSKLFDERGAVIQLMDAIGHAGGEGQVYKTDRQGVVAKIYHTPELCRQRMQKLRAMRCVTVNIPRVCWPTSLLTKEDGSFVGFLMQEVPTPAIEMGISIFKLTGEAVQNKVLPGWDRLSVIQACASVCDTFAQLHKAGILMGDINPRNFMVLPQTPDEVYFLDCDSYQVGAFHCPVGVAEYSSPEILRRIQNNQGGYADCPRSQADEEFSLVILLFQMALLGQYPYAAKGYSNIGDAILNNAFAFKTKDQSGYNAPDGPYRLIWNNMLPELRQMFDEVFTKNQRYSAELWKTAFLRYAHAISNGRASRELLPRKYYDATGDKFTDFVCVVCKKETNMWSEEYEKLTKKHHPLLCNQCRAILKRTQKQAEQVMCNACGNLVTATVYDKAMQEYGKPFYCPDCRHPKVRCAACGKIFTGTVKHTFLLKKRRTVFCEDCRAREGKDV